MCCLATVLSPSLAVELFLLAVPNKRLNKQTIILCLTLLLLITKKVLVDLLYKSNIASLIWSLQHCSYSVQQDDLEGDIAYIQKVNKRLLTVNSDKY